MRVLRRRGVDRGTRERATRGVAARCAGWRVQCRVCPKVERPEPAVLIVMTCQAPGVVRPGHSAVHRAVVGQCDRDRGLGKSESRARVGVRVVAVGAHVREIPTTGVDSLHRVAAQALEGRIVHAGLDVDRRTAIVASVAERHRSVVAAGARHVFEDVVADRRLMRHVALRAIGALVGHRGMRVRRECGGGNERHAYQDGHAQHSHQSGRTRPMRKNRAERGRSTGCGPHMRQSDAPQGDARGADTAALWCIRCAHTRVYCARACAWPPEDAAHAFAHSRSTWMLYTFTRPVPASVTYRRPSPAIQVAP